MLNLPEKLLVMILAALNTIDQEIVLDLLFEVSKFLWNACGNVQVRVELRSPV